MDAMLRQAYGDDGNSKSATRSIWDDHEDFFRLKINAATGFANSPEMKKLHDIRTMSAVGLMIAAFAGVIIWMAIIQMRRQ